jgi:hypothetical protein
MFTKLATSVGEGRCHVAESQEWADAAVQEGARAASTIVWASLGGDGERPDRAERDLFRWLNMRNLMHIDPYLVWIPRELQDELEIKLQPTPIIAPHEMMHSVFCAGLFLKVATNKVALDFCLSNALTNPNAPHVYHP